MFIFIYAIFITGGTYAYMVISNGNSSISGTGYCNTINYKAEDINTSDLVSTTNYLEGAKTNITLSQNEKCKIYTSVNINIYTNDTTTAPIDSVKALKYVVYQDTTKISEGVVDSKGEITLATVPLTSTSTTYTVYLWIDANISLGTYSDTTYSGYIYATSEQTSTIGIPLLTSIKKNAVLDNTSSTYVTSSTGIDFSQISSDTNGKGVYILNSTVNDTNPIYYYRGAVDNNNVLFAGFCCKIVRTTDTGGIKLIYNGTPNGGTCDNTGSNSQIGTKAFNSSYNSPAYVGYMYETVYASTSKSMSSDDVTGYVFGNDVNYSDGIYTLTNTVTANDTWINFINSSSGINKHRYTCFTDKLTCSSVYYVYDEGVSEASYIPLTNGKKVEDALSEMLDNNKTSSTIKGNKTKSGTIDYWYYTNIESKGYSNYVEDTIWCNDRSIYDYGRWDPNGGSRSDLYFGAYNRIQLLKNPSLTCPRDIDKFTVSTSNGNGDLDYPVGLLTADEVMLAGGTGSSNNTYYLYTGSSWWTGSPSSIMGSYSGVYEIYKNGGGLAGNYYASNWNGVRPSISLKADTLISGGDGTVDSPYIVVTNNS